MKRIFVGLSSAISLLLLAPVSVFAQTPSLFVTHLGTNISEPPTGDWSHSPLGDNGDFVQLYAEVGTHVTTAADNVTVKFELPGSLATTGQSVVRATSTTTGVSERRDTVTWDFRGATCRLAFVGGSASARVDKDRDGTAEINGPISDAIVGAGVNFGTFKNGVAQVTFKARVECQGASPTPTPTPTPTPITTPTPTPPPGGQQPSQSQSQTQTIGDITQNVNVTQHQAQQPAVAGIKELPKTGATVLAWSALASGVPVGFALRLYAARLRRKSQLEPDLSPEESSDWLELTAHKLANRQ